MDATGATTDHRRGDGSAASLKAGAIGFVDAL